MFVFSHRFCTFHPLFYLRLSLPWGSVSLLSPPPLPPPLFDFDLLPQKDLPLEFTTFPFFFRAQYQPPPFYVLLKYIEVEPISFRSFPFPFDDFIMASDRGVLFSKSFLFFSCDCFFGPVLFFLRSPYFFDRWKPRSLLPIILTIVVLSPHIESVTQDRMNFAPVGKA